MKKWHLGKLTLSRETLRQLTAKDLADVQGAGKIGGGWSEPPQCDTACTSQTLSCTL